MTAPAYITSPAGVYHDNATTSFSFAKTWGGGTLIVRGFGRDWGRDANTLVRLVPA